MLIEYQYMDKLLMVFTVYLVYCKFIEICTARRRRRVWVREMFEENEREMHGFYRKIFTIMKERDNEQFRKATRMGVPQFELLFNLLEHRLTKNSPRKPVEAECRLLLTLVYLSQGSSWQTLSWAFRLGVSTVREIILETCNIIWEVLYPIYLDQPNEDEWKRIAIDVYNMTGMPHCVGAIDGKHIRIKCPPNAGSLYYNYKSYHSIVLLAACDSNYCFTAVDIGAYGSQSDGGILEASAFGNAITNGTIRLPKSEKLPNSNVDFPYYFVGDAAFPLRTNIMRPYPGRMLSTEKDNFNKKLSRARVKIENTFGVMTARWRVLLNAINCFPENAEAIVKAVVVLHNFVKMHDGDYCPPNYVDSFESDQRKEGLWKEGAYLPQSELFTRFNAPRSAFALRDTLRDYVLQNNYNKNVH